MDPTVLVEPPPAAPVESAPPPTEVISPGPTRPPTGQSAARAESESLAATRVTAAEEEEPRGRVVGVLVAVEGELEGMLARVVSGSNRLGRSPECEVWLPSEWISRHHARIEYRRGVFLIEAASDKPTARNSEPIESSELHDGDTITLGTTTLRFRSIL